MIDYKKNWEECVKHAGNLEDELAKVKTQFRAELNAARNDYERYELLNKAYADECATNAGLQHHIDLAMSENQRLTKLLEDNNEMS